MTVPRRYDDRAAGRRERTVMSIDTLPGGVTPEQVRETIAKLLRVPIEVRLFNRTMVQAWRFYHLKRPLLTFMVSNGLPHLSTPRGVLFDHADLMNAGMYLGVSPTVQVARRQWPAGLLRPATAGTASYRVTYVATCPDPGHPPPCRYRVNLPDGTHVDREVDGPGRAELAGVDVVLDPDWPRVPAALHDWVAQARALEWMHLPHAARHDLDFVRRTRLADCWGSAELLFRDGLRRGLPVRRSVGLITAPPYSSAHNWVEIRLDGRWVPVDPHLTGLLVEWGTLDPEQWGPERSPGAILCRVGDPSRGLAFHAGRATRVTLATRPLDPSG
jgi:hypothetical protein